MNFKKLAFGALSIASITTLAACGNDEETIRVGVIGEDYDEWEHVADKVEDQGINLEVVAFTDYNQPNRALADGEIELNAYQHYIFLENFNEEFGSDLEAIANTIIEPLGIYSDEVTDVSEIEEGDEISIPNDVTNGGRALILLQSAGLIEVDPDAGITPTLDDVTDNPLDLEIVELDAAQTARSLGDVTAAIVNADMAVNAGFDPNQDAVFLEPIDENSEPYINLIAAQAGDDREEYDIIIDAYQAEDTLEILQERTKGSTIPVWEEETVE